jgi:hypothetical protein
MKKIFLHIILILNFSIMAQEKLFEKKLNNNTLKMIVEDGVYKTILINNKKETLTLDESQKNPMSLASIGKNQQNWFNIVDAIIKEKELFVIYYNFGLVELKVYHFSDGKKFDVKAYFIDKQPLISWDNGGGIIYSAQMKFFDHNLYMYIDAHQLYGGKKTEGLYSFKTYNTKLNLLNFSSDVKKIVDEEAIFKTLDLDKNIDKVSSEIKKMLINKKIIDKINNFKYLGNIDLTSFKKYESRFMGGYTYFFYQENNLITKIVTYDSYKNNWIIGNYTEEEIKLK